MPPGRAILVLEQGKKGQTRKGKTMTILRTWENERVTETEYVEPVSVVLEAVENVISVSTTDGGHIIAAVK